MTDDIKLKSDRGGGNAGPDDKGGKDDRKVVIKIDRETFKVDQDQMTGTQLRALPDTDIGPDRDLFQVVPGGSDDKVEDTEVIELKNGMRFFTAPAQINPGQEL